MQRRDKQAEIIQAFLDHAKKLEHWNDSGARQGPFLETLSSFNDNMTYTVTFHFLASPEEVFVLENFPFPPDLIKSVELQFEEPNYTENDKGQIVRVGSTRTYKSHHGRLPIPEPKPNKNSDF